MLLCLVTILLQTLKWALMGQAPCPLCQPLLPSCTALPLSSNN